MTELGYKTLRESIVDIIRKRIINRELQPGQKIVEQELAKEFKTSRAPIREALRELENEGLVEYVRNAGCSVKEITFEESFEIYLMRANYEIMAVRSDLRAVQSVLTRDVAALHSLIVLLNVALRTYP